MDRLYADVTEHELGYFELKQKYRKDMDTFYREEYYQNSHALYRQEYDAQELAYKNNLYRQKEYIVKTISGGYFRGRRLFWISAAARAMPCHGLPKTAGRFLALTRASTA